jgi:hypothetical protein
MVNSPLPCANPANAPYLSYAVRKKREREREKREKKKRKETQGSDRPFRITVFLHVEQKQHNYSEKCIICIVGIVPV